MPDFAFTSTSWSAAAAFEFAAAAAAEAESESESERTYAPVLARAYTRTHTQNNLVGGGLIVAITISGICEFGSAKATR